MQGGVVCVQGGRQRVPGVLPAREECMCKNVCKEAVLSACARYRGCGSGASAGVTYGDTQPPATVLGPGRALLPRALCRRGSGVSPVSRDVRDPGRPAAA